jgi:CDP-diacylglycerol--glycerol-3-phosphate 3-phosphatidyltransferase
MKFRQFNLPNILSLIRIALAFVFAILLFESFKFLAAGIFLLAIFTDILDGYLARKYKQITLLGKILDPAADRLLMLLTFLVLLFRYNLPLWLAILAFSYHLLVIFGWIIIFEAKGITIPHSLFGKMTSFLEVLMFFAVIFNFYQKIFFALVTFFIVITFINYSVKTLKILKTAKST